MAPRQSGLFATRQDISTAFDRKFKRGLEALRAARQPAMAQPDSGPEPLPGAERFPVTTLLFNKPFGVLTKFTDTAGRPTLADWVEVPGVYPAGRLDHDSEGLVILTSEGRLQARIAHPRHHWPKTYWVQVEGVATEGALEPLRQGLLLKDGPALPAQAEIMAEPPGLWPRDPPIRRRRQIPTSWLRITLREGRNRQVRRMTAAVGLPTLRLVRWSVGPWTLQGLEPGQWRALDPAEVRRAQARR